MCLRGINNGNEKQLNKREYSKIKMCLRGVNNSNQKQLKKRKYGRGSMYLRGVNNSIPHICHFFYTGKIFGELNLHQKTPIFHVKSVKNATFSRKI